MILKARRRITARDRELTILESSNLNNAIKKSLISSESLQNIVKVMKTEFRISPDAETRIWTSSIPDLKALRPLSNQENSLEQEGIFHGHYLIIEVKNEDGTWPNDVGYHKRTQYVSQHGPENQEYSSTERFKIFHGEIEEIKVKATNKKRELQMLNQELKTIDENHKRGKKRLRDHETELVQIKKQQETLSERRKAIAKDMQGVIIADKSLSNKIHDKEGKRRKLSEELKTLEDDLEEYAKTTKNILEKIDTEPKKQEKASLIEFMAKSIKEKEEALTCPVCLETASAPIYMCLQQHLICSSCRPKLSACPECRQKYKDKQRHRYAERDAQELSKLKDELSKVTNN